MTAPDAPAMAEVEAVLAVVLPAQVRRLYRESDGHHDHDGQWFVVWPVDRLIEENPLELDRC